MKGIRSNATEVIQDLERIKGKKQQEIASAFFKCLYLLQNSARRKTPVNTGWLRSSWHHVLQRKRVGKEWQYVGTVGTNVKYAPYVEFGTGIYATNGKGRKTPWVYHLNADVGKYKQGFYRTSGQKPKLMLITAWKDNIEQIKRILGEVIKL